MDDGLLVFEGLDTLADVYLNGVFLGHANNMHRTWKYQVKKYIKNDNVNFAVLPKIKIRKNRIIISLKSLRVRNINNWIGTGEIPRFS